MAERINIELNVVETGDTEDDIEIQRGNINLLGSPYGEAFPNVVTNPIFVTVNTSNLQNTINALENFKRETEFQNVDFYEIVHDDEDNRRNQRQLDIQSLIIAIKSIWYTFNSDLVLEPDNVENPHPYVNHAYEDYIECYEQENVNGGILSYIHPLLFPKIFQLVFINNQIPKSTYEFHIPIDINYNNVITNNNIRYIDDVDTILYIYRIHDNITPNKKKYHKKKYDKENKIGKGKKYTYKYNKINKIIKEIDLNRKRLAEL